MVRLTRGHTRNGWQNIITISVVSVIVVFLIYIYCYPNGLSEPSRFEKEKMVKTLYEIDKIILTTENSNAQQSTVDISKFKELISAAEFKGFLIVKGARIPATAILKDGKTVNILMATSYPVLYYDVDNNSTFKGFGNGFEFTGDGVEKYFNLIK